VAAEEEAMTTSETPLSAPAAARRRQGPRQRHSKALDVARRGLKLVTTRTNEQAESTFEQPASAYLDPAQFHAEIDGLFRRSPIFAALSVELPQPGSFKTLDIPRAPVVVVRQPDGSLRAFLNSIRTRQAPLADGQCGADAVKVIEAALESSRTGASVRIG